MGPSRRRINAGSEAVRGDQLFNLFKRLKFNAGAENAVVNFMELARTVVTKGKFAALKGRTPQCVSNWIKDGKITGSALVGEGHRAQIWVERADADLARSLDPAQQAAQPNPVAATITGAPTPPEPAQPAPDFNGSLPALRPAAVDDEDLRRRRKADADRAEFDAEVVRRKLLAEEGRWIDAATAQKAWAGKLAKLTSETETFLSNLLARKIADETKSDWKLLAALMRDGYREFRLSVSTEAQAAAEEMPEAAE